MIRIENLSVSYQANQKAIDNITLTIKPNEIIGIVGPNGAGKSTLMKAILHLVDSSGKILINDQELNRSGHIIAYVEQRSDIDYNFPITVKECVSLGTYAYLGPFHKVGKREYQKVNHYLKEVGLEDFANRPINSLSGGQFQRMLMARCLIQERDFIFLDEPFVGIDSVSEDIIIKLLKELKEAGKTILIVHHDLNKVEDYFDSLILLNKKLITYGPVAEAFTKRICQKPTVRLL
ncbi:metal ABC transporter ATP-binding protein [Streptococcus didelphis]|uniref:Metal ABC transporter ATP-binding protein n=1 Tax=Streptococcus didelphis TaxID=102886 RepID=A0ABY9LI51_9STRE|nr:metal ABC transporter ATP-binding protein [Streptococcus didelphis]WMB28514.1 metal ABC transporter ATP-binding protein [Streptococcus didelphis]